MRLQASSPIALVSASILALALSACAGSSPTALPGSAVTQSTIAAPFKTTAPGPLKATPAKLNFTTVVTLKFTVSEKSYTGKFKVSASPAGLIKLSSAAPKGPTAKLTATAINAGSGKISISDDHGGKKSIPFTVTQGVIIIQ
jgi:hypothetical protein